MVSHVAGPALNASDHLADRLGPLLDLGAEVFPDRPAYSVVLPNGAHATLSFAEVKAYSDAIAFYLRRVAGLPPGTAVAVMAPNCLAFPVVAKGIIKAGLIFTGINPLYTPREAQHQLADSQARVLFIIDLFGGALDQILADTAVTRVVRLSLADLMPVAKAVLVRTALRLKGLAPKPDRRTIPLDTLVREGRRAAADEPAGVAALFADRPVDEPLLYQYTSGTTGRSKGAAMSERNVIANASQTHHHNGELYEPGVETGLVVMPLYHVMALTFALIQAPRTAMHCVLAPQPRPLSNLRPAFERFDITVLPGINTLFQALMTEPWFADRPPDRLKLCLSGAAPLQKSTRERWETMTGCPIYEGYGLTEGTCVVTFPKLGEPQRHGTVGHPLPGTELKLVDDTGQVVPRGRPGEVVVRGPQVVLGYLNQPDATGETIRDGWLHTGDIGVIDEDGALRIVDRKKDMIIVSGFNVYPAEVEDVLAQLPGVAQAAVIGVPSEATGEAVEAFVVKADPALDEAAVLRHCTAHLTNYKRPRRVHFVPDLPKSPVGKILRRQLRDQAGAERTPA
ncbi:hypothetical protein CCR80_14110 [Rhodothalassium salexigens]|uniref:AMP-binding protein n=1 Tax=Rhodothalassium salexigens TaxID=1086 RepID=UPI0019148903|nr:AMP-binding protein [Rhodothalassium salexigens]MBK5922170.1 hypothetical protein [Rhodothalassium salexigens]